MTTSEIIATEKASLIPTYGKLPIALVRGKGAWVWDADGNRYLDFYGGHCVALLGHCPPRVTEALEQQAQRLLFYSNVVYSDVRARAASRLARLTPAGLNHVFFSNSGTEAVETALKLARTTTQRPRIIAMEGDFHGRTLGSLSTTWNPRYRAPFQALLHEVTFVPFGDTERLKSCLDDRVAAILLEPIQSIAGIREAPPEYYRNVRQMADANDSLVIFDEIQTGVGRTGFFSVSEHYGVKPDIITLAKSLGSGLPVGATITTKAIADLVQIGDHGSTFGGGMIAMAAVESTLRTIEDEDLMSRASAIFEGIAEGARHCGSEVLGRGCLIGLRVSQPASEVIGQLRNEGVLVGASADPYVLRLMPPINATDEDVTFFVTALSKVLA